MRLQYKIVILIVFFVVILSDAAQGQAPDLKHINIEFYNNTTNIELSNTSLDFSNGTLVGSTGHYYSYDYPPNYFPIIDFRLRNDSSINITSVPKTVKGIGFKFKYYYQNGTVQEQIGTIVDGRLVITQKRTYRQPPSGLSETITDIVRNLSATTAVALAFGISFELALIYYKRKKGGKD